MSVYAIVVFLHVVGALGVFAAMGLEWTCVANLRRASTVAQVREWARLLRNIRMLEAPAGLTILVTGLYLSTRWGEQPWIGLGLLGLIIIGVLGGALTGRRAAAIARAVPTTDDEPIPDSLHRLLHDGVLRLSTRLRVCLGLGVVFLMSVKPGGAVALAVIGVALAAGLILGLSVSKTARARSPVTSQPIGS